jgi:hypothetical protein
MSDVLDWLSRKDSPEPHDVTVKGETRKVYFRKLNTGERKQYIEGMKFDLIENEAGKVARMDLGIHESQKLLLVQFSVCDQAGGRVFRTIKAVQDLETDAFEALHAIADQVNEDLLKTAGK